MRILFFIRHDGFIRNFESVLVELAARGHDVHLGVGGHRETLMSEASSFDELQARTPGITHDRLPGAASDGYGVLFDRLCAARDHIRFLRPEYDNAPKLRARGATNSPPALRRLLELPQARSAASLNAMDAVLRRAIHAMPNDLAIDAYLDAKKPDVVLFTLLVGFGKTQHPYLLGAVRKGYPTALLLHSWDNLTNKGLIHVHPNYVLVWNEEQRDEAIGLHGIDKDRIVVTGAHCYDHWFDWEPTTTPADFRAELGIAPGRELLLYVGSSKFIAPNEAAFVVAWLRELRASAHPALRDAAVVVRPHPQNAAHWHGVNLDDAGQAVTWPPLDSDHPGVDARATYYDSIHHASAIVGINTSAFVESAIIGTPAFTILAPEFRNTQVGTLHFSHLVGAQGILTTASTFDQHFDQLAAALVNNEAPNARQQAFVSRFLRPFGGEPPPSARVADAVEAAAVRRRQPAVGPPRLARPFLAPLAHHSRRSLARTPRKRAGSWGADVRDGQSPRVLLFVRATDDRLVANLLRTLLSNGARVHVALDRAAGDGSDDFSLFGEMRREFPRLTYASGPKRLKRQPLPRVHRGSLAGNAVAGTLQALERALPVDNAFTSYVREYDPDVVLITPPVDPDFPQGDFMRAAAGLGLPTAMLALGSEGSSGGTTRDGPDQIIDLTSDGAAARANSTIQELAGGATRRPQRRRPHARLLAGVAVSLLEVVGVLRRSRRTLRLRRKRARARPH